MYPQLRDQISFPLAQKLAKVKERGMSAPGASRHFAAAKQLGRYQGQSGHRGAR
jgi:hypothetical protein